MATTSALLTVDEFLKLPDIEEQRVELIHGEVIEMAGSGLVHELVKANLNRILTVWLDRHAGGLVFVETSYRVDEDDSLIPDLSVLSNERIPVPVTNDLPHGAPDLAVEIVSSETAARLRTKIDLYLKHGSKAVWAVYPAQRMLEVHSANGQITKVEQEQILEEHDALPGFSTPVSAIFKGL
jgi:Uma2 family endonuclease